MEGVDYRKNPSAGNRDDVLPPTSRDQPNPPGTPTEPWPDETFRWYDETSEWNKPTLEQPAIQGWSSG